MNINNILQWVLPLLGVAIPGSSAVIADIQNVAKGVTFDNIGQLETDLATVAENYLPQDKAVFEAIVDTTKSVFKLIQAVEALPKKA